MKPKKNVPTTEELIVANSFCRTIGELRRGQTVTEASSDLAELVKKVQETGRPGELILKLKIRPSADGESVGIEDEVSTKMPRKAKKATTFYYADDDGSLSRENPNQREMFAVVEGREVPAPVEENAPQAAANA